MENDEGNEKHLKPPQYKRDEQGKFEQHGTAIKKQPKNAGSLVGLEKRIGTGLAGPGRPKGSVNKTTANLKAAILEAGERAGGQAGLVGYLTTLAVENSSAYAGLLGKILPAIMAAEIESSGRETLSMTFKRVIVYPNGQQQVVGQATKQIDAPASHMLPSEAPIDVEAKEIKDLE